MKKIDEYILSEIQSRLNKIEKQKDVEILYAVESGSRAWGFESINSDYDVRFIYKHRKNWYLSIRPKRDVIEIPIIDEFDLSGWDLKKSLFLLNKSNPVLFEWLNSPIVYMKNEQAIQKIKKVSKKYFSRISMIYHYLHMAKGNYRDYLRKRKVKIKKYFYVLRPILACMWINKYDEPPPMKFETLLMLINSNSVLFEKIKTLLIKKKQGVEMGISQRIQEINDFLVSKINYFEKKAGDYQKIEKPSMDMLNEVFIEILNM